MSRPVELSCEPAVARHLHQGGGTGRHGDQPQAEPKEPGIDSGRPEPEEQHRGAAFDQHGRRDDEGRETNIPPLVSLKRAGTHFGEQGIVHHLHQPDHTRHVPSGGEMHQEDKLCHESNA